MTGPLRVVLIGAGLRARKVYGPWLSGRPPYQDQPVRALAVVDTDSRAAREVAAHLPDAAPARPQDLDRILADGPDLVVVATPDASHYDYAAQALAAGIATLVEKPLATTTEDAFALVHADAASPGRLLVGHNLRFTNLHRKVHALLTGGHIGTVTGADFHYTLSASHTRSYYTRWHRVRAASGGLEVTKACHHLDLLAWWLDAQPSAVTAEFERRHHLPGTDGIPADADIHDSLHALIEYTSGATARYTLTPNAPTEGYTCTLTGTAGVCTVRYDARSGPHTVHLHTGSGGGTPQQVAREDGTHAGADHRMLTALTHVLRQPPGAPAQFATPAEAALAVATGTAMYDSSRRGRRLPVPQPRTGEPR
ncbi:Gfo/Idh/MocA family protein [Streptomyces graminilatus]|uniref:Gfo/Idh/MocA family protein n=1 Tax=Streptomyces graminilatus TaxID=1464070 RepID=UPI0006E3BB18|nr:Gfo/Idh/MocA family oxidoreductase [Streptomyces graminilatus]